MSKKRKQDEKTYKSSVFDNPILRVVIVIAVAFFILSIFGGTAIYNLIGDAIRKGSINKDNAYVMVNGDEIFVAQDPQTNKTLLTREAYNNVVVPIINLKQYFSTPESISSFESFATSQFNIGLERLVLTEMYKQVGNKVNLTIDPQAFAYYAEEDYIQLVDELSDPESEKYQENAPIPENEIVHEQNLRRAYKRLNVEKPIEEGILISKLDIKHRFNLEDTEGKIKYVFFTFDDFLNKSLSEIEISEEELKKYLEDNKNVEITTGLRANVLAFDDENQAEEASKKETPFQEEDYKEYLIEDIVIKTDSEHYSELVDLNLGQWKRAILRFGDKYALFKIKEKMRSKDYQEIVDADVLDELKKSYIKKKSQEDDTTYISDYKAMAEKAMNELKEKVANGNDILDVAENLNLSIYGETAYFTLSDQELIPADENMPQHEQKKHNEALKKAQGYEKFIYNTLTLGENKVSEVYNTSYRTEEDKELGLLDKDDYYYVVQLVGVKFPENITESRESTIAETIQKEYEDAFEEMKLNDLKLQNKIIVNRDRIDKYLEQFELFTPPVIETDDVTSTGSPIRTGDSGAINDLSTGGSGLGGINMGGNVDPLISDITDPIAEDIKNESNNDENSTGDNDASTDDGSSTDETSTTDDDNTDPTGVNENTNPDATTDDGTDETANPENE